MGKDVLQISLSDSEREMLDRLANDAGLSPQLYVKAQIFGVNVDDYLGELKQLVAAFPTGWFNIKQLFGSQRWSAIEKSQRMMLGKVFYSAVVQKRVLKVRAAGKDSANTQWYYKGIDKIYYELKVPEELIEEIEMFMATPTAEVDKSKALEYATKLSKAFCEGAQEFDAVVKGLTENAQERFDNSDFPDGVLWEINQKLGKMILAQNGYAVRLFDQLMELAKSGRRS